MRAVVPWTVRFPTMANHTATHLLHKALQEVLGDHVRQAGSAVRPDKLRFDFTHGQALTPEEREEVERLVNEQVFANLPVRTFVTPIDEARKPRRDDAFRREVRRRGARGRDPRLLAGALRRDTRPLDRRDRAFVILSEGSVGSGVRRIEALTSGEAFAYLHGQAHEAEELRDELDALRKAGAKRPQGRGGGRRRRSATSRTGS